MTIRSEAGLSNKQLKAIPKIAGGMQLKEVAREVGVAERTMQLWKQSPAFMAALHQAEADMFEESMALLKRTTKAAIMTLVACMDPKVTSYVRMQAAGKLLDQSIQVAIVQEVDRRMAVLEDLAKELQK